MADEREYIIQMPFNEEPGSTIARDLSGNGNDGVVENGFFVAGQTFNALYFPGYGKVEVIGQFMDVTGEYTFSATITAEQFEYGPKHTWLIVNFAGKDRYLYLDLDNNLSEPQVVTYKQGKDTVAVYIGTQPKSVRRIPFDWGRPTGWALLNDNGFNELGYCTYEDLVIYKGTDGEIPIPSFDMAETTYSVDGVPFLNFEVNVSKSRGLWDMPKRKEPFSYDNASYHGRFIDLSEIRYEEREIVLECYIGGVGKSQFQQRVMDFMRLFDKPNTVRLQIDFDSAQPLVYEVWLSERMNLEREYNGELLVGSFQLTLRESNPVKKVVKVNGPANLQVVVSSDLAFDVHFGDKTAAQTNLYGQNVVVTHSYPAGTYYAIFAGVIEKFTRFDVQSANTPIVWNRL